MKQGTSFPSFSRCKLLRQTPSTRCSCHRHVPSDGGRFTSRISTSEPRNGQVPRAMLTRWTVVPARPLDAANNRATKMLRVPPPPRTHLRSSVTRPLLRCLFCAGGQSGGYIQGSLIDAHRPLASAGGLVQRRVRGSCHSSGWAEYSVPHRFSLSRRPGKLVIMVLLPSQRCGGRRGGLWTSSPVSAAANRSTSCPRSPTRRPYPTFCSTPDFKKKKKNVLKKNERIL